MEVTAYFSCADGSLRPVLRAAPASTGVLRASLEALFAGPNARERAASLESWFSPATGAMLRSVALSGGHAVVDVADLRAVIPNASASAGSTLLLSQLDATVFQFDTVASVEYRLEGSCEDFTEWLQIGGCEPHVRPA
jgi:spore germination protein GerM